MRYHILERETQDIASAKARQLVQKLVRISLILELLVTGSPPKIRDSERGDVGVSPFTFACAIRWQPS